MAQSGGVDDEDDSRTITTVQESFWLAGVNRQAQPTAQLHQRAASQAAAAKRTREAMTKEEAKRRRADHMKEVRAREKAEKVAAEAEAEAEAAAATAAEADAAAAAPTRELLNEWLRAEREEECGQDEWLEFTSTVTVASRDFEQHRFVQAFLHEWRATMYKRVDVVARGAGLPGSVTVTACAGRGRESGCSRSRRSRRSQTPSS